MQSKAATVEQYLAELPEERQQPMTKLRKVIKKNLPKGFKEGMGYGMIGYVVPHSLYSEGYHCDPKQPLPFMSLASQKNYISVYHMGMYSENDLGKWFIKEYAKLSMGKLDMGKCCIRFKNIEKIPYELIGELSAKLTPQDWISFYEKSKPKKK
ncbi:MAG TPA: DUF1801 domain-containing protein [Chitinophagaceae bacterium]|nr:DUF1801 domain-containing protein [Chitinophagaceae bacterium]MCB9054936.1 DUF1801 domain-containing protein [Chitinophagales bacterium]HPG12097.1 DUF1801 domain-containing protein [Chitinophagaceae bacterium]HRX92641.1 DUF1801 domain-containing protein [Chitinophagaceae bacterium]